MIRNNHIALFKTSLIGRPLFLHVTDERTLRMLNPERLGEIGVAVVLPALAIALTGLAARLTRN